MHEHGNRKPEIAVVCVFAMIASAACDDRATAQVCPTPFELFSDNVVCGETEGVDLLVVVDDSPSMIEERAILAQSVRDLVLAFVAPPPSLPYEGVDGLRVAVVTSDMGMSAGGVPYDGPLPPGLAACSGSGDDGAFRTAGAAAVRLDGAEVRCPPVDGSWPETSEEEPDPEIAVRAACLADREPDGCPIQQPLAAAGAALARLDQASFFSVRHLPAVLVISDEDDCTLADAAGLLASDELSDPARAGLACGLHPEHLAPPASLHDALEDRFKPARMALFAAIAGVPYGDQDGADECQGLGYSLGSCLDLDAMRLEEVAGDDGAARFRPACERYEEIDGGVRLVARATPARRLVEIARDFHALGTVRSICEPDWAPAIENILRLAAPSPCGSCFGRRLPWDEARRVPTCDLVAAFVGRDRCPWPLDEGEDAVIGTAVGSGGGEVATALCPLPKLPMALDCHDAPRPTGFGWYYCENARHENSNIACHDDVDNDGDGLFDCADAECATCDICGGPGSACSDDCPWEIEVTDAALPELHGAPVTVQCMKPFTPTDSNCREDSPSACNDGADNDGNGAFDCDTVVSAGTAGVAHAADPQCCPMEVSDDGRCNLDPDGDGTDDYRAICGGAAPAAVSACLRAKEIAGCTFQ